MLRSLTPRRMASVALLASAALVLTGCGSDDKKKDSDAKAEPTATPTVAMAEGKCDFAEGGESAKVKVTGTFGAQNPKAEFDKGLKAEKAERTIITPGTGETTKTGDNINVVVSAYIGRTAKEITSEKAKLKAGDAGIPKAFDAGIDCVPVGSRVVATFPAADLYGASGNSQLGIKDDDTLVVVTDVISVEKPAKAVAWPNAPKVTFSKKGVPSVKLTGKPSPTLQLKVLKPGTGAVVAAGDSVSVDYQGTSWNTKKIFDQSYGKAPATFTTDAVVPGFGAALVGQKVGTRLIVTIPPKYGYGEGAIGSGNLVGETLVFVIEIRSTKAAS